MCRENAALLELPRSESQTVLRHLHCSVRLTQVELSVALVTVHPVVFSFSKEPNPEAFERIRNILLATSYTKKVG